MLTGLPEGLPDKAVMIMDQDQGVVWVNADLWFVGDYTVIKRDGGEPSLLELSVKETETLQDLLYQVD